MIEHKSVKSSTIVSIGFDAKEKILEVLFNSGGLYQYSGVPKEVADAFLQAESKGNYFAVSVRPCFPCRRLHATNCNAPETADPMRTYVSCTSECLCWCHKQRKDVSHGAQVPNPALEKDLKKSIKKAKAAKRIG